MNPDAISLKAARINAKRTIQEIADILGVSKFTVINWEKYKSFPTVVQAYKLCELYRRPIDSIIFVSQTN